MHISWRTLFCVLFCAGLLAGQVPPADRRNVEVNRTETHFGPLPQRTLPEWEARRTELRRQILTAAGLSPLPERTPLHSRRYGRVERPTYTVERVQLETLPGFFLTGNLYLPRPVTTKMAGVLVAHGHWKDGRAEDIPLYSPPALAANLAHQGYAVFAYDMLGYNDTKQTPHKFGESRQEQMWALGPLGLQLWNSMRALDFLSTVPGVDSARIGMTGASGGGTQTFLLTAVDDRLAASAPVNMVSSIYQGGCPCENACGLRVSTNNVEIAALMAPKPMLLVSATGDWTKHVPQEEFPRIQSIYRLYGQPDRVEVVQIDAEHNYNRASREAVYAFFRRRLQDQPGSRAVPESLVHDLKKEDLLSPEGEATSPESLTFDGLQQQWRDWAKQQTAAMTPAQLRERLGVTLGTEWPARVQSLLIGVQILLSRPGEGDRVPGQWWHQNNEEAVLVIHPEGAAAARKDPAVEKLLQTGASVLLLDSFQTGAARAHRNHGSQFLAFNRTEDAARVQDILTALAYLTTTKPARVRLLGLQQAAVWAAFAAAVAPVNVQLDADLSTYDNANEEWAQVFFVPGIQRAGGLAAARRLMKTNAATASGQP